MEKTQRELDELLKELKGEEIRWFAAPSGDRRAKSDPILKEAWRLLIVAEDRLEKGEEIYLHIQMIRDLIINLKLL